MTEHQSAAAFAPGAAGVPPFEQAPPSRYAPPAPNTIEATGMTLEFLGDLVLKIMFRRGVGSVTAIADVARLSVAVIGEVVETLRHDKLIATLGQLGGDMRAEMRYELTESGRMRAVGSLAQVDYAGPCPVPLDLFLEAVKAQSVSDRKIQREKLEEAFGGLVLPDGILDRLGPAVNSGRSILLYGPPGNGKSSYAHALARAMEGEIFAPYAILVDGEIIQYFDPSLHRASKSARAWTPSEMMSPGAPDLRFVECLRPAVVTGAELKVDMLDLRFNPTSRTYQAPIHLKAANGVLIVDDLGRQRETPQELINRCIVPMEEGVDYLSLQSGLSFQVPFDTLMIFSTNIAPTELVDGAGLRRIYYKLLIERPSEADFIKIFLRVCRARGIQATEEAVTHVVRGLYGDGDVAHSAYHAVYLIDQALAACDYHGGERALRPEFLDQAWANLIIDQSA